MELVCPTAPVEAWASPGHAVGEIEGGSRDYGWSADLSTSTRRDPRQLPGRLARSLWLERAEHLPEQAAQRLNLVRGQVAQQRPFALRVRSHRFVDHLTPRGGQLDHHGTAVVWISRSLHEALTLETIQPACHAGRREHQSLEKPRRRQAVRRPGHPQGAQHTHLAPIQAESPEHIFLLPGDVLTDPGDSTSRLVGVDIKAGTDRSPPLQQAVRPVLGHVRIIGNRSPAFEILVAMSLASEISSQDGPIVNAGIGVPPIGDAQSAAEIALGELGPIYGFLYSRVGNRADAEDLTQQVALKALPRLHDGAPAMAVRAYLYATARSVLASFWARRGRVVESELPEDIAATDRGRELTPSRETVEWVARILERLTPSQRRLLELRFLRGYTLKEVAAEMGKTVGSVKVMQLRALRAASAASYALDNDRIAW
jgi:RNA polymerase sigma factor (sigma-70 family)